MIDYEIIGTGSKGNAVRLENIMIDWGVPFKKMHEALYKCDTLLITHRHSDHIKESTYFAIRKQFPRIKVYGNSDVAQTVPVDKVIGEKPFQLKRGNITITPVMGCHDVDVTYFFIAFAGSRSCTPQTPAKSKIPRETSWTQCFWKRTMTNTS